MLRVALFPADDDGCGRYRLRYPAAAADVEAVCPVELTDRAARREALRSADVVVFQRPADPIIAERIPKLQRIGKAVVVDLDDDLASLDPRHPTFETFHPRNRVNWQQIKRACQLADLVTVSTPALAQRYGGSRARVLPNCVPEPLLSIKSDRDGRTVGWGGNTNTHVDDLTATGGGVAQALGDTGARFLLVGKEPEDAQRQLGLEQPPATVGYIPFDAYHRQIARFDVGIAPLRTSLFNRCKSGLKVLEMAALRVPTVASPLPEYVRLHDDGIGLLAERGREWRRQVRRLLTDPAFADETASRAHAAVAERHVLERNAWRWAEAWQEAADLRRGSLKRAA